MTWAGRLARLTNPYVESADSVDSPSRRGSGENTPLPKAPKVPIGNANDTKDAFDIGVELEKRPEGVTGAPCVEAANDAPPVPSP